MSNIKEIVENFQYQLLDNDKEPESIISGYLTNGLIRDKETLQQVLDQIEERNQFAISAKVFDRYFISEE